MRNPVSRALPVVIVAGLLSTVPVVHGVAQTVFRTGIDAVTFGVTVVDREGRLIDDLTAADFELFEDGRKQSVDYFARGSADSSLPPLHVGLLFDTSGSMEADLRLSRSAAIKFLNTLSHAVDMTLVDFDSEVRVARYGQNDFPRMVERIRTRKPDGATAMYDALGVYLDGAAGQEGRKVLVVYTDGGDTGSSMSFPTTCDLLKASDVTVYVVGFMEHQSPSVRGEQQMRLRRMAELTGGQAYFPSSMKAIEVVYGRVVAEMSAQYTLGFSSANRRMDGSWRRVEIRLTRADLRGAKVRTRSGYFAPYRATATGR